MKALFILIGVLAIVAGGAVYYIACLNARASHELPRG